MWEFWRRNNMALAREGKDVKGGDNYATTSSQTHYGKGSILRGGTQELKKCHEDWERIFGNKYKENKHK